MSSQSLANVKADVIGISSRRETFGMQVENWIWRIVLDGWDLFTLKNIGTFISGDPTTSDRCNWMFSKDHPLKENSTKHTGAHIIAYVENKENGTTAKQYRTFQVIADLNIGRRFLLNLAGLPKCHKVNPVLLLCVGIVTANLNSSITAGQHEPTEVLL